LTGRLFRPAFDPPQTGSQSAENTELNAFGIAAGAGAAISNAVRDRMEIAGFAADAKTILPEIEERDLQLGYTGLRPKLKGPGEKGIADFVIEADREVPRVIQLVGIESPGLTAAGAIADVVAGLVAEVIGD
jgi:L-2-hydroxyglutarate oxidase LhgO